MFSERKEELSINVPIQCGGVVVNPGDFIVADLMGVVVVPQEKAAEIVKQAQEQADREEQTRQWVAKGKTVEAVTAVANAGGQIIVSPNLDRDVGRQANALGLICYPGVMTPSEAFTALKLGAAMLKFFPAELISPQAIAALRAALPDEALIAVVGGITPGVMRDYMVVEANGFGLGSALFKPGIRWMRYGSGLRGLWRRMTRYIEVCTA